MYAGLESPALLAVNPGADPAHLTGVAADAGGGSSGGCSSHLSEVTFSYQAGTSYLIAVDGKGGAEAFFSLTLEAVPVNDDAAQAQVIGPYLPTSVYSSNRHATKESGETNHAGDPGGASVWYSWTPSTSGKAFLSACMYAGKGQSALLAVYTGSDPEHLTAVTSDAGGGSTSGCYSRYSEVAFDFVGGTRYLIAVDGPGGLQSSFSLSLEGAPANDDFAAAQSIVGSLPRTVYGTSRRAGKQPGEPEHAGRAGGASVWYSWAPAEDGIGVISACGQFGGQPPLLGVYTGADVADLTEVAADAGGGDGCYEGSSEVEFDAVAGETYYVAVDDSAGAGLWSFNLEVDLQLTPANDAFAAAEEIPAATNWFYGSNRHASKEIGEPEHAGQAGGATIWV
jgi:hypothetical protein